jgi:hypothetical protein
VYAVTTATEPTPSSQGGPVGTSAATSAVTPPATTSSHSATNSRFRAPLSSGTVLLGSGVAAATAGSSISSGGVATCSGSGAGLRTGAGSTARTLTRS